MNTKKYLLVGAFLVVLGFLFNLGMESAQAGGPATSTGSISVSYPGFLMKTNKESYAKGEVISLKIKRLDGKFFPYYVDVIAIEETTHERKFTIRKRVNATAPIGTIVQINTSFVEPFAKGENGRYLLVIRASGEEISNGSNSNSIYINYYTPSSIVVLSPNGGEKWVVGSKQKIIWKSTGIPSGQPINIISLKNFAGIEYHLLYDTPNDGSETIIVPNLKPGTYKLYIETMVGKKAIFDSSNNFFKITPAVESSITVLSPNGGEICVKGQICKIKWTAKGIKNLMIGLQGPSSRTILASAPASGRYYSWIVPVDIVESSAYKILIGDIESPLNDQSDNYFSIAATSTMQSLNNNK